MIDSRNTPICEFCGKPLEPIVIDMAGKRFIPAHKPCDCVQSTRNLEAEQAEEALEEAKRKRDARLDKLRKTGIPERYWGATTTRRDLIAKAEEKGLWIEGPFGVGKTHLACAIALEFFNRGKSVRFVKAADLVDMMSQFSDNLEAIDAIKAPHLLVIDDMGMTEVRDWSDVRLRRAIDARWDAMKPTIITSNFSRRQLAERMGDTDEDNAEAVVSRLFGMTARVELDGKDRRLDA